MNKKDIMRQASMETVVVEMIRHQPGVTSNRLFETAKEWAGKSWSAGDTADFDALLVKLRLGDFRCTNKQWYEKGHVSERKLQGPSKADPRQARMFG